MLTIRTLRLLTIRTLKILTIRKLKMLTIQTLKMLTIRTLTRMRVESNYKGRKEGIWHVMSSHSWPSIEVQCQQRHHSVTAPSATSSPVLTGEL